MRCIASSIVSHPRVAALLSESAPDLLKYFLRRVADAEDAADLLSETLEGAWRSERRMPTDDEPARMWVFGIARNQLRHHRRSVRRRGDLVQNLAQAIVERRSSPEVDLDVRAAVESLPEHLSELVKLVHWDGFTLDQSALLMRIPASTARSRHVRAKELLRAKLLQHSSIV